MERSQQDSKSSDTVGSSCTWRPCFVQRFKLTAGLRVTWNWSSWAKVVPRKSETNHLINQLMALGSSRSTQVHLKNLWCEKATRDLTCLKKMPSLTFTSNHLVRFSSFRLCSTTTMIARYIHLICSILQSHYFYGPVQYIAMLYKVPVRPDAAQLHHGQR